MALQYQYVYAEIDLSTGECIGVFSSSVQMSDDCLIELEVKDYDYIGKYYINGSWYEDSQGITPWSPA